jgi:hypothetical protein
MDIKKNIIDTSVEFKKKQTRILIHSINGKQEFRRTDFGSRLLAAEGEGGKGQ